MALRLAHRLGCCCTASSLRRSLYQVERSAAVDKNIIFTRSKSTDTKAKQITGGPISWKSFGVLIIVGGSLLLYVRKLKQEKEEAKEKERTRSMGKASLGGPFSLIDVNGERKTDKDFLGKWMILYFGFTFCPDICPDELEKLSEVITAIDELKGVGLKTPLQPVFITVDPARDSPSVLKTYLADFHPHILGLTGNEEEILQATRAYRVYYSPSKSDEDNDYLVDHTIIMYLVDPDGKFTDYYGQNKKAEDIVGSITSHMLKYQQNKK